MPIENNSGHVANFASVANDRGTESAYTQGVRTTQSLAKPAQMSFVEKLLDFFGLGNKAAAHAEEVKHKASALVSNICSGGLEGGNIAEHHQSAMSSFVKLRDMAMTKYQDQFSFDYQTVTGRDDNGHERSSLHYQFIIAGTTLLSASIDANDRDDILAFHQAMVSTGIEPLERSSVSGSAGNADAQMLTELENMLPKLALSDAPPSMASLAAQLNSANTDPRFVMRPHAAMGEKVRILSEAFPRQQFSIDFTDRHHYAITVRPAGKNVAIPLYQAKIGLGLQEQAQFPTLVSAGIKRSMTNELAEHGETLNNRDKFILTNAQTMCEKKNPKDLEKLIGEQKNPDYSSAKLKKDFTYDDSQGTFTAHFGDKSLVFSNRAGSSSEFRGEKLRARLSLPFDNLEQIMSEDHLTVNDQTLNYIVNSVRMNYLLPLELTDHERAEVFREIGDVVVGKSTLRDMWDLREPVSGALSDAGSDVPGGVVGFAPAAPLSVIDQYFDPASLA